MRHPVVDEDIGRILAAPLPWQQLAGKTVLVSGAIGFIPLYLAETVLTFNERSAGKPARLLALVRDRDRAEARFAAYRGRDDIQLLVQDVREPVPSETRADIIIHAASPSSPRTYGRDPDGTIAANVDGTRNLLELARRSGSEAFLYLSSSEVYGRLNSDQVPVREDQFGPLDPTEYRSCYAESKRLGETLCACWSSRYGVPARIVRPFHTYGPRMRQDDGRVFADFVADVLACRPIVLRSSGSATRSFCYLADAVAGFFTVLFRGQNATAYNIGDDRVEISIRALAELLVATFPERRLSVRSEARPADDSYIPSPVERSYPDISRVRSLGWCPTTPLADGFRRTVASFA